MGKKHTIEYIRNYFKEHGCELLEEEYINNYTKMKYECSCENISEINFGSFQQGHRCKKCANKKLRKDRQFSYKYVKQYFKKHACDLLEDKYINNCTSMKYKCICGNISKISFASFQKGTRCAKCGGTKKHTFEFIKDYFKKQGCKILEKKYINSETPMKYKCKCGNISKICFYNFKMGKRCRKCAIEKNSGTSHYNYNPNLTNEDRVDRRLTSKYKKWRKKIYAKDNYICQNCFQKGKYLNAHHIKNYTGNKKLRFIKSNGITLCNICHTKFHKMYGYKNNDKQQLKEFLKTNKIKLPV